jgi:hypothetical protein
MRAAARRVAGWQVAQWSRGQNTAQGLAPSTDQMLLRAESERDRLPAQARPPPIGSIREGEARMWAHRLRVQYGVTVDPSARCITTCDDAGPGANIYDNPWVHQ